MGRRDPLGKLIRCAVCGRKRREYGSVIRPSFRFRVPEAERARRERGRWVWWNAGPFEAGTVICSFHQPVAAWVDLTLSAAAQ